MIRLRRVTIKNIIIESETKECTKCNRVLQATTENFYTQKKTNKDGHTYYTLTPDCKECRKKGNLNYYYIPEVHERRIKQHANYRKDHVEERRIYRRKRRDEREDVRNYEREWRRNNKDKVKIYGKLYSDKKHDITEKEWNLCKDYFNYRCAYCGIKEEDAKNLYGQNFHREHVIPDGRSELKNCIPACRKCNTSKHTDSLNNWYNPSNPIYSWERYYKIYTWLRFDVHKFIEMKKIK